MSRTHRSPAIALSYDRRTRKHDLLRLCARVGFTPPGDLQPH